MKGSSQVLEHALPQLGAALGPMMVMMVTVETMHEAFVPMNSMLQNALRRERATVKEEPRSKNVANHQAAQKRPVFSRAPSNQDYTVDSKR